MAQKFLTPIDLAKNELQNAVIQNLAVAPGSPAQGQVYFNTTDKHYNVWNGTAWQQLDGVPAHTQDWSTITGAPAYITNAEEVDPQFSEWVNSQDYAGQVANWNSKAAGNHNHRLDQLQAPQADVSMNNHKLTGLAAPATDADAATKAYVDNMIQGLSAKDSVRAATTANIADITGGFPGTIDGVVLDEGDRVLLKNQSNLIENGIYVYDGTAPRAVRAADANTWDELVAGYVWVSEGTQNGSTGWICTIAHYVGGVAGMLGTNPVTWTQFSGAALINAGTGLSKSGNTLSVTAPKLKYAADSPATGSTSWAVTHNLGTQDVTVSVYDKSTNALVFCDVVTTNTNTVTLGFSSNVQANQYHVVILG